MFPLDIANCTALTADVVFTYPATKQLNAAGADCTEDDLKIKCLVKVVDDGLNKKSSPDEASSVPFPKFPAVRTNPVPCAMSSPSVYEKRLLPASE